jgi:hypothetical protein
MSRNNCGRVAKYFFTPLYGMKLLEDEREFESVYKMICSTLTLTPSVSGILRYLSAANVDTFLGNDHETSNYTTAAAK